MTEVKLYDWQREEVEVNGLKPKRGIFGEPRTGKTLAGVKSLERNIRASDTPKILITCPKGVGGRWVEQFEELDFWSGIPVIKLYSAAYGSVISRVDALRNLIKAPGPFIVILNPAALQYVTEILLKIKFDYYIADESHMFSNPNAKQSKSYRKLASAIPWVRPMTGTPTSGGLEKFWSQLQPLEPLIWGPTYASFRREHLVMHSLFPKKVVHYQDENLLHRMIAHGATLKRREDVFGPDQWVPIKRHIILPERAQRLYRDLVKKFLIEDDGLNVDATHTLTRLLRAQQLASGFIINDKRETVDIHTAKLDAVEADLGEIIEQGEKAIIFHRYKWESKKYTELVSRLGVPTFTINGDVEVSDREQFVKDFAKAQGSMVGVVQIQSGGIGISFAEADHALRVSRSFSFIEDTQALDRVFKPGKPRTVTDYEAVGTVDALFASTLDGKRDLHNVVMSLDLRSMLGALAENV